MKFGRGHAFMQPVRRVFVFLPVQDIYGYWLWLETVLYDPKDGTYLEISND